MPVIRWLLLLAAVEGSIGTCPAPVLVQSSIGSITVKVPSVPTGAATCRIFRDDCAGGAMQEINSGVCGAEVVSTDLLIDGNCRFNCQGLSSGGQPGAIGDTVTFAAAGSPNFIGRSLAFSKYGASCVRVVWPDPDAQGSPVFCYTVKRDAEDEAWVTVRPCSSNADQRSQVVCGLEAQLTYRIAIFATNRVGTAQQPLLLTFALKNMLATPQSEALSPSQSVKAGTQTAVSVQALDPVTLEEEQVSLTRTNYPSRVFISRLLNPSKFDETGVIEVPLGVDDAGYTENLPYVKDVDKPITAVSQDNDNGQYVMNYAASKAGQYSLVVRTLESGGLYGQYWDNQWFFGLPLESHIDADVNFDWGRAALVGFAADFVSIRWTGFVLAGYTEKYTFYLEADDNVRLWIDDVLIIDKWQGVCCGEFWGVAELTANMYHHIRIDYRELTDSAHIRMYWSSFSQAKTSIPANALFSAPAIKDMPVSVEIQVGEVDSTKSIVFGPNLVETVAGQLSVIYVQAADTERNNLTDTSIPFVAQFTQGSVQVSVVSAPAEAGVNNGIQALYFILTKSGSYNLRISARNAEIRPEPFVVNVLPGPPAAIESEITAGLAASAEEFTYEAGVEKTLTLTMKDIFENEVDGSTVDPQSISATMEWLQYEVSSGIALVDDTAELTRRFGEFFFARVSYSGTGGAFYLMLTNFRAGSSSLAVKLETGTVHVQGSPFAILGSHANEPSGPMSVYKTGDPPSSATAGASFAAEIQLRDAFGNVVVEVPSETQVAISVGPQPLDRGACTHQTEGVFRCSVVPRKGGAAARFVSITVNGQEVSVIETEQTVPGPFPIKVEPGAVFGGTSTVVTKGSPGVRWSNWALYTGDYIDVLLILRDSYGNALSEGTSDAFNANVYAELNSEALQVTNNHNGTFTLRYGSRTEGKNVAFECTVNGVNCGNAQAIEDRGIQILSSPANSAGTSCDFPLEYVAGRWEDWECIPRDVYLNEVNFTDLHFVVEYFPLSFESENVVEFNGSYATRATGEYTYRTKLDKVGEYSSAVYLAEVGGLFAQYYRNMDFNSLVEGDEDPDHLDIFSFTQIDAVVNFNSASDDPSLHMHVSSMPRDFWSVRWSGWLLPKATGLHSVYVEADMGVRLTVNHEVLVNAFTAETAVNASGRIDLVAGAPVPVTVEYRHATSESYVALLWSSGDFHKEVIPSINLLAPRDALKAETGPSPTQRRIQVVPDEIAATSEAAGAALNVMTAGLSQEFTFVAYDKFKNKRDAASTLCPTTVNCKLRAYIDSVPEQVLGEFAYASDGDYTVTIEPSRSGVWPLFVQVYDEASEAWQSIVDSPFSVEVFPGAVVPAKTLVEGEGQERARAGQRTCFNVTLRDSNENNVYGSGEAFDDIAMMPAVVAGTIEYAVAGIYKVCYMREITGQWTDLKITVSGVEISFLIQVLPGVIAQDGDYNFNLNTEIPGTSTSSAIKLMAGESNVMTLIARDAHGNQVDDDAELGVTCEARGRNEDPVRLEVVEQASGVWELDVNLPDSGTWKLGCAVARAGGLNAKYFANSRWLGPPSEYVEPQLCVDWGQGLVGPGLTEEASAVWDGFLSAPFACDWQISLEVSGGGRAYVWVDGRLVGEGDYRGPPPAAGSADPDRASAGGAGGITTMSLSPNKLVPLQLVFWNDVDVGLGGGVCLRWSCQAQGYTERTIPKQNLFHSGTKLMNFRPSEAVTVVKPARPVQALYRATPFQTRAYTAVWWPPVDNGGLDITGYRVRTRRPGIDWSEETVSSSVLSITKTTEFNDVQYQLEVAAITRFVERSEDVIGETIVLNVFPCILPGTPVPPELHGANDTLGLLEFELTAPTTTGCGAAKPVILGWEISWNEGYGEETLRFNQSGLVAVGVTTAVARVKDLVVGRNYKFSQRWYTEVGWSAWSAVATFDCCRWVHPSAVRNVRRDFTLPQAVERISLTWDEPEFSGSTSLYFYRVYYSNGVTERHVDKEDANDRTLELTGAFLYEDSDDLIWRFEVTAFNAVGEGSRSKRITLLAVDQPNAPTQPQDSWVYESSVDRIGIQWEAPTGSKITGYRVYVNDGEGGLADVIACDLAGFSSTLRCVYEPIDAETGIGQLLAGSEYKFEVVPLNEAGEGERSGIFSAFAASRPGRPGRPKPNIVTSSTSQIVVTWTAPVSDGGKDIVSYTVERQDAQDAWQVVAADISILEYVDTDVDAFDMFRYRVYAVNGVEVGSIQFSNEAELVASAPLSAPTVGFDGSTEASISVAWQAPTIPVGAEDVLAVTGYKVYVNTHLAYDGSGVPAMRQFVLPDCEAGEWYDIKVTSLSLAGESALSDCCAKPCARKPYRISDPPRLVESSKISIKIAWLPPANAGGLAVTGYVVQRAAANSLTFSNLGEVGSDELHYADATATAGTAYRYRVYAMNEVNGLAACNTAGFSNCDEDASGYREFKACRSSDAPSLTRVAGDSSSVMELSWAAVDDSATNGGCVATGYRIYSNDGLDGPVETLVYDGLNAASALSFRYVGVIPGRLYRLQSTTLSQAGEGTRSAVVEFYAAKAPGKVAGLRYVSDVATADATDTQISVEWNVPSDTGGNAIVMWEVVHDNGNAAATSLTVKQFVCDPEQASAVLTGLQAGTSVRVSVRAHGRCLENSAAANAPCPDACTVPGEFSETVTFVAASMPSEFSIEAEPDLRTRSTVGVVWTPCSTTTTAGCVTSAHIPLLRFDLYKDDCNGGDFAKVGSIAPTEFDYIFTQTRESLPTSSQGLCGFYVEAVNARGRRRSTETIYEYLVGAPGKPPAPIRVSSTTSAISLRFNLPEETGGATITSLKLYRDDPVNSDFQISKLLTTLPYDSLEYVDSAVSSGVFYHYQVVVVNEETLESVRSDAVNLVAAAEPNAPSAPVVVSKSTTSATLSWTAPANEGGASVTRFVLYQATSLAGTMIEIYRGSAVSRALTLETNVEYIFRIAAINAAGEGAKSEPVVVRTVDAPTAPGRPSVTSSDCASTSMTLTWDSAVNEGGCPVEEYELYVDGALAETLVLDGTYTLQNSFTFEDKACDLQDTWLFQIKAKNCDSLSEFSQGLTTRNADQPEVVAGLAAAYVDSDTLNFSWSSLSSQSSPAFLGYKLFVDDGRGGPFRLSFDGVHKPDTTEAEIDGFVPGRSYRAYVTGVNEVAEGEEAAATVLVTLFAFTPSAPVEVAVSYNSADCITVQWTAPAESGGVGVTGYELEYAPGPSFSSFTSATLTPNTVATVKADVCSLSSGVQYQFRVRAVNEVSLRGSWSPLVARIAGALPGVPQNLRRISSTKTSTLFEWDPLFSADFGGGSVVGYKLYLNQGLSDRLVVVHDGRTSPNVVSFDATGLVCGRTYSAKVSAVSEVGEGAASAVLDVPMFVAPSAPQAVKVAESTSSKIRLEWTISGDTGCFEVALYKLERDCGNSGVFEVVSDETTDLFYEDTTVPSPGAMCVYRVAASNAANPSEFGGYSEYVNGHFATLPDAVTAVTLEATSRSACRFSYTAPANDGGVAISYYEIQADDGLGGEYASKTNATALIDSITSLTTGRNYRVRVAAWNPVGRGPWSAVSTDCTAADKSSAPRDFKVSSVSGTSFRAQWQKPFNDGGSLLLQYEVWVKTELETAVVSTVNSAASSSLVTCTAGALYEVKVRARTQVGWGVYTHSVYHLCDEVPAAPLNLRLTVAEMSTELEVTDLRSTSSISVTWDASADDAVVTQYNLYVDDGQGNGLYRQVFSGKQYTARTLGLVRGRTYRFTVSSVSQAGEGARSSPPVAITMQCVPAAPPRAPVLKSRSEWDVTLEWEASLDSCGGSITGYRVYRDDSLVFPVSNYFVTGKEPKITALGLTTVDLKFTPASAGKIWAILSSMSRRSRFDIVNAVYALSGSTCRVEGTTVAANVETEIGLTGCPLEQGDVYYVHVYLEGEAALDYDGVQAALLVEEPVTAPVDTRTNKFTVRPSLAATPEDSLIKVKFTVEGAGVVSGVVALAGADLSVADVIAGGGADAVGAVFTETVVAADEEVQWEFDGPFAAGNIFDVYVYVASQAGDEDGELIKVTAEVSVYLSNTFFVAPTLTSAISTDGFSFRFTGSASVGRLWAFVTNAAGKAVSDVDARLTRGSVGDSTCKRANVDISASQNDVVFSGCDFRAGVQYYLHVYIEGTHGPAGPTSEADGSLWVPVAVAVPAPSVSAVADTTADLFYVDEDINKGTYHNYNVRTISSVGVGYPSLASVDILAAGVPSTPGAPLNPSRSQTSAYLQWGAPHDGGSTIVEYVLEMAEVVNIDQIVQDSWVTVYVGAAESHVQAQLVPGFKYAFRVAARSYGGTSDFSAVTYVHACAPPSMPMDLSVSSRSTTGLVFNWLPPSTNGGCADVEYIVKFNDVEYPDVEGTSWSSQLLTAGSSHTILVRASSFGGLSACTATFTVIAAVAPDEVAKPTVTAHSKDGITITWSSPTSNGGSAVTGYRVYRDSGLGGDNFELMDFVQTTTFTTSSDVIEGRQYCFKISAENAASYSAGNMATLLAAQSRESDEVCEYAAQVPAVVATIVLRRVVARQIIVDWVTPVSDNGSPIVYYEVYGKSSAQVNFDLIATSGAGYTQAVYEGCSIGDTYTFKLRAKNAVGFGPDSNLVSGKCAVAPSPPVNLLRSATTMTSATMTWSASQDTNGAAITTYNLNYQLKGSSKKTRVSSGLNFAFTHSPLVTGVTYVYTVTASNEAGESQPSSAVSVLAAAKPGRPTRFRVLERTRSTMVFGWDEPSSNGGTPITFYEVYYGTTFDGVNTLAWRGLALNTPNISFVEGELYFFNVAACNGVTSDLGGCVRDTEGLATKLSSYAAEIAPEVPVLTLGSSTLSSLTVAWDSRVTDTGAQGMALSGFKLYADNGRGGEINRLICEKAIPDADDPEKIVSCLRSGLAGGVPYRYQLVVANPVGDSERGPVTEFRTCDIPYAPQVFEVQNRTMGNINITWAQVPLTTCPITSYQVLRSASTPGSMDDCNFYEDYDVIGETTNFSFLYSPGGVENYCLKVRGQNWQTMNSEVVGQATAPIYVRSATAPSPPGDLSRIASGSSSITVSWTTPQFTGGEAITGYEVAFNDGQGGDFLVNTLIVNGVATLETEITNLAEGRLYAIKVRARNAINVDNPLTDNADCCWSDVNYFWTAETPCQPLVHPLTATDSSRVESGFTIRWEFNDERKLCAYTADLAVRGYLVYRSMGKNLANTEDPLSSDDRELTELVADYSGDAHRFYHIFTGLIPGWEYVIGVTALNDVGESVKTQSAGIATVVCCTTPGKPEAPVVVPLNGLDSALFRVSWVQPLTSYSNPITAYTIYRDDGSLGDIVQLGSPLTDEVFLNERFIEISQSTDPLANSEGKIYRFQVAATNYVGTGRKSDITVFQACKKPAPPDSFDAKDFTDNGLSFEWTPSSDAGGTDCYITKYVVTHVGPGGQQVIDCETSAQTRTCAVTGLLSGIAYSFQLTAFNQPAESEAIVYPSPTGNSFRAGAAPKVPTGLEFFAAQVSSSEPQLTLTWDEVFNVLDVTGYEMLVKMCNLPGDPVYVEDLEFESVAGQNKVKTDINKLIYASLTTSQPVCVQVRAKNINDVSGWSAVGIFMVSDLPPKPQTQTILGSSVAPVSYKSSTSTSLTIEWNAVTVDADQAPITHYRVTYSNPLINPDNEVVARVDSGRNYFTIVNVNPEDVYSVRVASCNINGCSADTSVLTLEVGALPEAPTALRRVASSGSTVTMQWTFDSSRSGGVVVKNFFVELFNEQSGVFEQTGETEAHETSFVYTCSESELLVSLKFRVGVSTGVGSPRGTNTPTAFSNELIGYCATNPATPNSAPLLTVSNGNSLSISLYSPTNAMLRELAFRGWQIFLKDLDGPNSSEYLQVDVYDTSATSTWTTRDVVIGRRYEAKLKLCSVGSCSADSPVSNAIRIATPPDAPTSVFAAGSTDSTIDLGWTHDGSTGGAEITDWFVYVSSTGLNDGTKTAVDALSGARRLFTFDCGSISRSKSYIWFRVSAVNSAGEGAKSTVFTRRCSSVPSALDDPFLVLGSTTAITIGWLVPDTLVLSGANHLGYRVCYRVSDPNAAFECESIAGSATTRFTLIGLNVVAGTKYDFKVAAVTEIGTGDYSAVVSFPAASKPSQVLDLQKSSVSEDGANRQFDLTWNSAGIEGGSSVTKYTVYASTDLGATYTSEDITNPSITSYTYSACPPGQRVYFKVTASNAIGEGTATGVFKVRCCLLPEAPDMPERVSAGISSIRVGFSYAGKDADSCDLVGYKLSVSEGAGGELSLVDIRDPTAREYLYVVTTGGPIFNLKLKAVSEGGESEWSANAALAAADVPLNPVDVAADSTSNEQVVVSWSMPSGMSDGGSAITGYRVYVSSDCVNWETPEYVTASSTDTSVTIDCSAIPNSDSEGVQLVDKNWEKGEMCVLVTALNAVGESAIKDDAFIGADWIFTRCSSVPAAPAGADLPVAVYEDEAAAGSELLVQWTQPGTSRTNLATYYGVVLRLNIPGGSSVEVTVPETSLTRKRVTGLEPGRFYDVSYAWKSSIGIGSFSAPVSLVAAGKAQAPIEVARTTFDVATKAVKIVWSYVGRLSNGGVITGWKLRYARGTSTQSVDQKDYTDETEVSGATNYEADIACESTTPDSSLNDYLYIVVAAVTDGFGAGFYSSFTRVWCGDKPNPVTLTEDVDATTDSQVAVKWTVTEAITNGAPIDGFKLYKADDDDNLQLVEETRDSSKRSFVYSENPTAGEEHFLAVRIITAAGESDFSNILRIYACRHPVPQRPTRDSSRSSGAQSMMVWPAATQQGCVIMGYRLYRRAMSESEFTSQFPDPNAFPSADETDPEDESLADALVLEAPSPCTGVVGEIVYYKVRVYTAKGFVDSTTSYSFCAGLPLQMAAPVQVGSLSSDPNAIQITWTPPDLSGGQLTRYKLYIDGSLYTSCIMVRQCVVTGKVSGDEYLVTILAISDYGEGPLSDEVVMTAAALPAVPTAPEVTAASMSPSITFSWTDPSTNGLPITGYAFILREDGTVKPEFTVSKTSSSLSSSYSEVSLTLSSSTTDLYAVSVAKQYELCVKASTSIGTTSCSGFSSTAGVANGYTLSAPSFASSATITRHSDEPAQGTVKITWPDPTDYGGDSSVSFEVMAVTSSPTTEEEEEGLSFTTTDLEQSVTVPVGELWLFRVRATNLAGVYSAFIGPVSLRSCSKPNAPTNLAVASDSTEFTVTWEAPSDFGGVSSLTGYRVYQDTVALSPDLDADVLQQVVTQDANAVSVVFAVSAINECGEGPQSDAYAYTVG